MSKPPQKTTLITKYSSILDPKEVKLLRHTSSTAAQITSRTKPSDILEKVMESRKNKLNSKLSVSPDPLDTQSAMSLCSPQYAQNYSSKINFQSPQNKPQFIGDDKKIFKATASTLLANTHALTERENTDGSQVLNLTNPLPGNDNFRRKKPSYNPYFEKELTLEDLYKATEEHNKQLQSIINQEYDEKLTFCIKNLKMKEFNEYQRTRFTNVFTITEHRYVEKILANSKVDQELWKILTTEISRIRSTYEDFLLKYDETIDKISAGKEKVTATPTEAWEAVHLLIDYSNLRRNYELTSEEFKSEKKLEKLKVQIHEFKVDYKCKKNYFPKILEMYELVEKHINHLNDVLELEKEKFEALLIENQKLLEGNRELIKNHTIKSEEIMALTQEWKKGLTVKSKEELPGFQVGYYEQRIEALEAELKRVTEKSKEKIKAQKAELKKRQAEMNGEVKMTQDAGVWVNFFSGIVPEARQIKLSAYFSGTTTIAKGNALPLTITMAMINMIYSDKMIADFGDDFQRRPRKNLNNYLPVWFLKRFGLYSVAESVIQDFMLAVKEASENYRIQLFVDLGGVVTDKAAPRQMNIEEGSVLDRSNMLRKYYNTAEALKQFYRIMNFIRIDINSYQNQFASSFSYGPYLPFTSKNHDLLFIEVAKNVLHLVLTDENFSPDDIQKIDDQLMDLLKEDLYHRLLEDRQSAEVSTKDKDKEKEGESKYIRLDPYLRFIMDLVLGKQVIKLEKFYTVLKLNIFTRSDSNLSSNEFANTIDKTFTDNEHKGYKNLIWKDHAFACLMDEPSADQIPLHKLIGNMVERFMNENNAKDFYQKVRMKKDGTLIDDTAKSKIKKTTDGKSETAPPKNFENVEEALLLGDPILNDAAYLVYDCVSSLALLQEMYGYFSPTLKSIEKQNETLFSANEQFRRELDRLPVNMIETMTNDAFILFGQKELVDFLEHLWAMFREILTLAFRNRNI